MSPEIHTPPIAAATPLPYAIPSQYDAPPDWTNVQVFHLAPHKRTPFLLVLGTIHFIASLLLPTGFAIAERLFLPDLDLLGILVVWILGFLAMNIVGLIILLREFQAWPRYRLLLADQGFIRFHSRAPTVHAATSDIARIVEEWDVFRVYFHTGTTTVLSKRIADPDSLRQSLARWTTIQKSSPLLRLVTTLGSDIALNLGAGSCFLVGFNTNNGESIIYAEFLGTLFAAAILRRSFRKKGISRSDRISSFFFIVLPLALAIRLFRWFQNPPT